MPAIVPHDLSVLSRIMIAMQKELRNLQFRAVNNEPISPIKTDAIVIRRIPHMDRQEGEAAGGQEETPGIIISPPESYTRPGGEGENDEDEVHYSVACQIIDRNPADEGGLHTYLAWQQKIGRQFARTDLSQAVFDEDGYVYFGHSEQTTTVDPAMFVRHALARAFVVVHFIANEP